MAKYMYLPNHCTHMCGLFLNSCQKLCLELPLYDVTLEFPFTATKPSPNLLQEDNAPVYKARLIKPWFSKIGMEQAEGPAQSPDCNLSDHHWDELEC